MKRSIYIPLEPGVDEIDRIRSVHDSLFAKIQPHVTLVFPFNSEIADEQLKGHITDVARNAAVFRFKLSPVPLVTGNFIVFPIISNAVLITELHDALYEGILSDFLSKEIPYNPHVTVARCKSQSDADVLSRQLPKLERLNFDVRRIILESIQNDESGNVEFTCPLKR